MSRVLSPKTSLLLICDVQERFKSAIYGFDAMVGTISKMVRAAKLLEMRVVATEQNPKALGSTVSEIGLAGLPKELNLGNFPKTKFSMMIPEIQNLLVGDHKDVESIIISGIESHVCVLQTVLSFRNASYPVYVLADGVSSCNRQEIPISLERMRQAGAIITTSESLLFQLIGDAGDPLFKPFAALVKEEKTATSTALQVLLDGAASSPASQL